MRGAHRDYVDFRRFITRHDKLARNYFSALCLVEADVALIERRR
jgi:hypothetical protein